MLRNQLPVLMGIIYIQILLSDLIIMTSVNHALHPAPIDYNIVIMVKLEPSLELADPIDIEINITPSSGAIAPYFTKITSPTISNSNHSISRFMTYIKDIITCYITLEIFKNRVACNDQRTYEKYAIKKLTIEGKNTSPITRVPLTIQHNQTNKS